MSARRRLRNRRDLAACSDGQVLETRTLLSGTPIQLPINNTPLANGSSSPRQFVQVGSITFFLATDDQNGEELWKTDGTTAGTTLVKDIKPGTLSSGIQELTNINGTLYFRASEEGSNYELWKSDGTAEGTVKVNEIRRTIVQSFPSSLSEFNGKLLFAANNGSLGSELWISDGTEVGTTLIKDIFPGFNGGSPGPSVSLNGVAYFSANQSNVLPFDRELWRTDGTEAGTYAVVEINPGNASSNPSSLTRVNNTLYFVADNGTSGVELWKTDGTAAGSVMVKDINPTGSSSPSSLININGTLYFTANDGTNGVELWKTDGTPAGTVLVRDINPGGSSSPSSLVNLNGVLAFAANDGTNGAELWTSDGTSSGTVIVGDIQSGSTGSNPASLTVINNKVYFQANDGSSGVELWVSDGTNAGTTQVLDIQSGSGSSIPVNLFNFNGTLLFRADNGTHGSELWRSDGTAGGTVMVKDLRVPQSPSNPKYLTNVNGTIFFQADDGVNGPELWKTDGTVAGTTLVKDIRSGSVGANPGLLTNVNGTLFFVANDGTNGPELWASDGTSAGTVLVKEIFTGSTGSSLSNFTEVNGMLYFSARSSAEGQELWRSDGTSSGTVIVKDLRSGPLGSGPRYLVNVNGTLYFRASDGPTGYEVWKSDGTSSGTTLVADLNSGFSQGSYPANLTNVNGTLFFRANDILNNEMLYKSDGTSTGTVQLGVWGNSKGPRALTAVNDTLYFRAADSTNGYELWKSDGTTTGTTIVRNHSPGSSNSYTSNLTNVNGTLYFRATDNAGSAGVELWKTDGTSVGTVQVAEITPRDVAAQVPKLQILATRNDRLYLSAAGGDGRGIELWTSDGTSGGTVRITDINAGAGSSNIAFSIAFSSISVTLPTPEQAPVIVGGNMFFAADNGTGIELWMLDLNLPATAVTLQNTTTTLPENTSTATAIKLADIVVADDGLGTNVLSLSGTDAAFFEIVGNELRLKASTNLNFEAKTTYNVTVQVNDAAVGGAVDASQSFTLNITDVNEAPTAVLLQNTTTTLAENTSTTSAIKLADIVVTDVDAGTNDLSLSGTDAAFFEIFGNELRLVPGTTLDFETKSSYSVTVEVNDATVGGAIDASQSFTLNITDVNEAPTAVLLQNTTTSLAENTSTTSAIKLADIVVTDVDAGTNDLSLSGADAAFFEIVGNELRLVAGTTLDFETKSSYSVTVEVNDATVGGAIDASQSFTLNITDVNEAPTAVLLQNTTTTLAENTSTTSAIKLADIVVTDVDAGTNDLSLSGTDASFFEIVGNELRLIAGTTLDFETKSSYSVTVEVNDATVGGAIDASQSFTLNITDVNEAPTAVLLQNTTTTLAENTSTTSAIKLADIVVTDVDAGTNDRSLSGPDAAFFEIVGNELRLVAGTTLDFETKSSYSVTVEVNDAAVGGAIDASQSFTLNITDVNEAPTAVLLQNTTTTLAENTSTTSAIKLASIVVTDVDAGTNDLSLSGTDAAFFEIVGNELRLIAGTALDFETKSSYSVTVEVNDAAVGGAIDASQSFTLSVLNLLDTTTSPDAFVLTYTASDVTITHSVNGGPAANLGKFPLTPAITLNGLDANDSVRVVGTAGNDVFSVSSTGISINGAGLILNGPAARTLAGAAGNDTYEFDADTILGLYTLDESDGGSDTIDLSPTTTAGISLHLGTAGTQVVQGASLSLVLSSGTTFENAVGTSGSDTLTGNVLGNSLEGRGGNDTLNGFTGSDTLTGGAGDDTYVFGAAGSAELDTLIELSGAGSGIDTLNFAAVTTAVTVNLGSTTVQPVHGTRSLVLNLSSTFENVLGGSGDDRLTGNGLANILSGRNGNDTLNGFLGNDSLAGGAGDDSYVFGASAPGELDTLTEASDAGSDTLDFAAMLNSVTVNLGMTGSQLVDGARSISLNQTHTFENLLGGSGDDLLTGGSGNNILEGRNGNDTLNGFTGSDTLQGGAGDDTYLFGAASSGETDVLTEASEAGSDTLNFGSVTTAIILNLATTAAQPVHTDRTIQLSQTHTFENAIGGSGDDMLTGGSGNNLLDGRLGNDTLNGFTGSDTLIGGFGDDTFVFSLATPGETDSVEEAFNQGTDTLSFSANTTGITVNLSETSVQLVHTDRSLVLSSGTTVENVLGGSGNDIIFGNSAANELRGNSGNDLLVGLAGNDTLNGGPGFDVLVGGRNQDVLQGSLGEELLISGFTKNLSGVDDDLTFLLNVQSLWAAPAAFNDRVQSLTPILSSGTTVRNDSAVDTLSTSEDGVLDWIFAALADGVTKDVADLLTLL